MISDAGDVVVVPFPFTDGPGVKRRPALVLSTAVFNRRAGHTVMAMITTARRSAWPGDIPLPAGTAGLQKQCVVRMKLFTLDNRLIVRVLSNLPLQDKRKVRASLDATLA